MSEIVYLNGEFMPARRGAHTGARPRLHLRRRRLRGDPGLFAAPVPAARASRAAAAQPRCDPLANPLTDAEWTRLDRRARRAQRRRGPVDLPAGHARRGEARSRLSQGREADGLRDERARSSTPARGPVEQRRRRASPRSTTAGCKCDVKSMSLLGNCLLRQAAADAGAVEVVMFRDGYLTEGSSSNVFVVRNGVLLAPPKNHLVLPGITYDVVLELARGDAACRSKCGRSRKRRCAAPTSSGSPRRPRKCSRSPRSTASRSAPASRARCSGRCTGAFQDFKRKVMRAAA